MTSSIYLAAPLFTQAEVAFNQSLADQLTAAGTPLICHNSNVQGLQTR
jgi:nucleoside 2-deoxyribosyltransferase